MAGQEFGHELAAAVECLAVDGVAESEYAESHAGQIRGGFGDLLGERLGTRRQFALAVGRADDDEEVVGIEILDGELAHVVDRRIVLGSQDIGDGVGHELSVAGLGAVEDDDGHDLLPCSRVMGFAWVGL